MNFATVAKLALLVIRFVFLSFARIVALILAVDGVSHFLDFEEDAKALVHNHRLGSLWVVFVMLLVVFLVYDLPKGHWQKEYKDITGRDLNDDFEG